MTMITRVGYCPICAREQRPKTGQQFIVFGDRSKSFKGVRAVRNGNRGFTPHIYEFHRMIDNTIYFTKTCCMNGCGAYLTTERDRQFIYLDDEKQEEGYSTIKNWNYLVTFKNTGFEI